MSEPPPDDAEGEGEGADTDEDTELPLVWERPAQAEEPLDRLPEVRPVYRAHQRSMARVAVPLMVLLVPTMQIVFLGVVWILTRSDVLIRTLAPVLGMLTAIAVVAGLANWLALLGNRRLEHKLREVLRERYGREGGELVGVSVPGGTSFMKEQMEGQSDVAILYEDADALVVEGMRERRVIKRSDVRAVSQSPNWQFIQFGAKWCVITHAVRDADGERQVQLRLVSRRERTVRRNVHATRQLYERLRSAPAGA